MVGESNLLYFLVGVSWGMGLLALAQGIGKFVGVRLARRDLQRQRPDSDG